MAKTGTYRALVDNTAQDSNDEKWGCIDSQGKWVVPPIYNDSKDVRVEILRQHRRKNLNKTDDPSTDCSAQGIHFVRTGWRTAFKAVDRSGHTVRSLDKRILGIEPTSEGLSAFYVESSPGHQLLYGYLDEKGDIAIPSQYQYAGRFEDGVAPVLIGEKWCYIDRTGHVAIELPTTASGASSFRNGFAFVAIGGIAYEGQGEYPRHGAHWGVIDKHGRFVVEPKFLGENPFVFDRFKDGLVIVSMQVGKFKRYGFADEKGQIKIAPQFKNLYDFADGLAVVCLGETKFSPEEFKRGYLRGRGEQRLFEQFQVIGMEKWQLHKLLGLPGPFVPKFSWQTELARNVDREYYLLSGPGGCGNSIKYLEFDFKNGCVRRYREAAREIVGGWVYDGRQPSLALEYYDTPRAEIDPDHGVVGIEPCTYNDRNPTIWSVTPGLPAAAAGLLPGDEILSMNGKSLFKKSYESVIEPLGGKPGTWLTIEIRRGKEVHLFKLRRLWVGDIVDFRTRCKFLRAVD